MAADAGGTGGRAGTCAVGAEDEIASFTLAEVGAIAVHLPAAGDLNDDGVPEISVNYMADGRGPFPDYVLYPGGH